MQVNAITIANINEKATQLGLKTIEETVTELDALQSGIDYVARLPKMERLLDEYASSYFSSDSEGQKQNVFMMVQRAAQYIQIMQS